jgi:hypothetical protein
LRNKVSSAQFNWHLLMSKFAELEMNLSGA